MNPKGNRQGELVFIKVEIPDWVKKQMDRKCKTLNTNVIREGEITGHKHEIEGDAVLIDISGLGSFYNDGAKEGEERFWRFPEGDLLLTANNQIVIKHPEHKATKLSGDNVIRIQREYVEGKDRKVND